MIKLMSVDEFDRRVDTYSSEISFCPPISTNDVVEITLRNVKIVEYGSSNSSVFDLVRIRVSKYDGLFCELNVYDEDGEFIKKPDGSDVKYTYSIGEVERNKLAQYFSVGYFNIWPKGVCQVFINTSDDIVIDIPDNEVPKGH